MTAARIFICHRRGDAERQVGRLLENLGHCFDPSTLYQGPHETVEGQGISLDGLHAMVDARAVLIMIGPNWASLDNLERLHETDGKVDPLRRWIALALTRHGVGGSRAPMLLPILLDGASMPDKASLPKDLKALSNLTPLIFTNDKEQVAAQFDRLTDLLNCALGTAHPVSHHLPARLFKPIALALSLLFGGIALSGWLGLQLATAGSSGDMQRQDRAWQAADVRAAPDKAD